MKRFICFAVAFLAAAAITSAQNSVIVIRGVTLIDGTGRGSVPNATVVIEGNTITDVTIGDNYSRLADHPEFLDQPLYRDTIEAAERQILKTEESAKRNRTVGRRG